MYYATYAQYIEYGLAFLNEQKKNGVNTLRHWLGPAPQNYWILDDGRILPATIPLPDHVSNIAYMYDHDTQRITLAANPATQGRFKRACPYLSVVIQQPNQDPLDLSDWINELKANPVPMPSFTLPQLIELWSAVHHTYVGTRYTIEYINSEGMPGSLIIA